MANQQTFIHPYMPSSDPRQEALLLQELGIKEAKELYAPIPDNLLFKRRLNLPEPLTSEYELKKHLQGILAKNKDCDTNLSFLGGGCWQHYVPAVCDDIIARPEFLTAYWGDTYSDKGKYQALFEYTSMMGELLGFEAVTHPTYDWSSAASSALLMAQRITNRKKILIPATISYQRKQHMKNFCSHAVELVCVDYDKTTGLLDMNDLRSKLDDSVAGVYFENPNYLGVVEVNAEQICAMAHEVGAVCIAGVDPISLGILEAPANYGADIAVGDNQPLGNHMNCGGSASGFMASRDEDKYCDQFPTIIFSLVAGKEKGDFGFVQTTHSRTSYVQREAATDYIGTSTCLAAIASAVYMSLMGPAGMREIGETILQRREYAQQMLSTIDNVNARLFTAPSFKEFVVDFNKTGKTVEEINKALLAKGIYGGKDLSKEFPELGQCALYCVTEVHSADDIQRLADAVKEVTK